MQCQLRIHIEKNPLNNEFQFIFSMDMARIFSV